MTGTLPTPVGTVVEAIVARIGAQGDGVAAGPDGPLYIPLSVAGDRVHAKIAGARGDGLTADLLEILTPGPGRAEPPCAHFGRCGGCALQHLSDDAYARWKLERLHRALARAGLGDCRVLPLVRTPPGARRRAAFAAMRPGKAAAVLLGFTVRKGHDIVDLRVCPVLHPRILALLPDLRRLLERLLAPGQRTHVAVTLLDAGLDVVLDWAQPPGLSMREQLAAFAADADLARLSWRPRADALAEPVVQRRPAGVAFAGAFVPLPPGAFVQASAEGEAALAAAVCAAVGSARAVADLFAGAGTFTFPLAKSGARVHAVDADAAALAALAAAARTLAGVTVEVRTLFSRPLLPAELNRFDAVVFDPPRAGAHAQAKELARSTVPVVVAVSCNPDSFARDARILAAGGYRLDRVTPIDQFLWSPHLELAAVFRR